MFALTMSGSRDGRPWALALGLIAVFVIVARWALAPTPARAQDSPARPAVQPSARPTWWFPHNIRTGTVHEFHMSIHTDLPDGTGSRSPSFDEEVDFRVEIHPRTDGRKGVLLRLAAPRDDEVRDSPGLAHLWLRGFAATNRDGIQVGADRVSVLDGMLLNGPWREGDRYTLAGFSLFFFDMVLGFVHFEVKSIDSNGIHFGYEFWFGKGGPAARGTGDIWMNRDERGMASFRASWQRTNDYGERRVSLSVTRSKISPMAEVGKKSDG